jgi:hypothetical protein
VGVIQLKRPSDDSPDMQSAHKGEARAQAQAQASGETQRNKGLSVTVPWGCRRGFLRFEHRIPMSRSGAWLARLEARPCERGPSPLTLLKGLVLPSCALHRNLT